MQLTGKIALITGGTRGIGAATATALGKQGADVAIVGRRQAADGIAARDAIRALGRRCEIILADCAKADDCRRCVQEAENRLGALDILVHSAGGPVPGGLLDLTPEAWNSAFDVHVHAVFHLCRAVMPAMRSKKAGAIVLISSVAGLRSFTTNLAYQAVKGALPQMTRALAREFAPDNIQVNCVAPGIIRTAFHAAMTEEQKQNNLENRIPLRREGTPEQVADLILELVRNEYITGETVTIDGGLTMRLP